MTDYADLERRLRAFNTPDRVLDYQRPAAEAIHEAADALAEQRERIKRLEADVAFLAARADSANSCSFSDDGRDTGVSSNAIVRFAYGGKRPTNRERPFDQSDLDACERAFAKLPGHRKTADVQVALDAARAALGRKP